MQGMPACLFSLEYPGQSTVLRGRLVVECRGAKTGIWHRPPSVLRHRPPSSQVAYQTYDVLYMAQMALPETTEDSTEFTPGRCRYD